MVKEVYSCVKPARGPLIETAPAQEASPPKEKVKMTMARVGQKAPDFEATAFIAGEGERTKCRRPHPHRQGLCGNVGLHGQCLWSGTRKEVDMGNAVDGTVSRFNPRQ